MTTTAGRPRTFDEDQVLERALSLFWSRGYRDTTTRELEDALGISQSSLYNAFGSKLGLFMAVLDRYEERTTTALITPLEQSLEGLSSLESFFEAVTEWVTVDGRTGCLMINLMADDGGATAVITQRTAQYRHHVRAAIGAALDRSIALGEIGSTDVDTRGDLLFAAVLGINIAARGGSTRGEVNRLMTAAIHLIRSWDSDHR